jgi:hypothetical protein
VFSSTTNVEAPKKLPSSSRTTAANAEHLEFLETIASTLILAYLADGLIHRGGHAPWVVSSRACFFFDFSLVNLSELPFPHHLLANLRSTIYIFDIIHYNYTAQQQQMSNVIVYISRLD